MTAYEEWYNNFKKQRNQAASTVEGQLEITQDVLWIKNVVVEALKDTDEELYTFRYDDKFGFSERLVNQLMQYAIMYGRSGTFAKSIADNKELSNAKSQGFQEALTLMKEFIEEYQ